MRYRGEWSSILVCFISTSRLVQVERKGGSVLLFFFFAKLRRIHHRMDGIYASIPSLPTVRAEPGPRFLFS